MPILKTISHDKYDKKTKIIDNSQIVTTKNDIALAMLKWTISYTNLIKPITLPLNKIKVNDTIAFSGFGKLISCSFLK